MENKEQSQETKDTGLAQVNVKELRQLCREQDLPTAGRKADLVKRLQLVADGVAGRFTPARTICRMCGSAMRVMNTRRKRLKNGRILVTRQMTCSGRHRHSYPLKDVEGPENQESPQTSAAGE